MLAGSGVRTDRDLCRVFKTDETLMGTVKWLITTDETRMGTVKWLIGADPSRIETLQRRIEADEALIGTLQSSIEADEALIGTLQPLIEAHQSLIRTLQPLIEGLEPVERRGENGHVSLKRGWSSGEVGRMGSFEPEPAIVCRRSNQRRTQALPLQNAGALRREAPPFALAISAVSRVQQRQQRSPALAEASSTPLGASVSTTKSSPSPRSAPPAQAIALASTLAPPSRAVPCIKTWSTEPPTNARTNIAMGAAGRRGGVHTTPNPSAVNPATAASAIHAVVTCPWPSRS